MVARFSGFRPPPERRGGVTGAVIPIGCQGVAEEWANLVIPAQAGIQCLVWLVSRFSGFLPPDRVRGRLVAGTTVGQALPRNDGGGAGFVTLPRAGILWLGRLVARFSGFRPPPERRWGVTGAVIPIGCQGVAGGVAQSRHTGGGRYPVLGLVGVEVLWVPAPDQVRGRLSAGTTVWALSWFCTFLKFVSTTPLSSLTFLDIGSDNLPCINPNI